LSGKQKLWLDACCIAKQQSREPPPGRARGACSGRLGSGW